MFSIPNNGALSPSSNASSSSSANRLVPAAESSTVTVDGTGITSGSGTIASGIQPPSFLQNIMSDNPYFSAGAGLMGITAVLAVGRKLATVSAGAAQRRMLVSLEISSKDRSYPWFLEWMAVNSKRAQESPDVSVLGRLGSRSHELSVETTYKKHENGSSEAMFSLVPGPGTHYFRYHGAWMQVKRERSTKQMDLHSGTPWETLTLTTLSRDRDLFPALLGEARELALKEEEGKTVIFTAWGVEWRPFGKPRRRREMKSVVLDKGVAEKVESDLRTFLGRAKWYADRGIPYRRGYLLHGPPGSGKSSFIQALAGSLDYNICLLNLSERGLTDDKLNHLLSLVPERSIILLEDIDAAFNRRVQTSEDGYKSAVTFSGLLNCLDGVASTEERIIFMTTNHFEKLDPALVRPGRVDLEELLDDATPHQARVLCMRFYNDEVGAEKLADDMAEVVASQLSKGQYVSMASLQGHFIRHGPLEALATLESLFFSRATIST